MIDTLEPVFIFEIQLSQTKQEKYSEYGNFHHLFVDKYLKLLAFNFLE